MHLYSINIGYRLSAFGFLASEEPKLLGNYGFKDQWLGLEWVSANIEAFGGKYGLSIHGHCLFFLYFNFCVPGDPSNIQVTGLSAGIQTSLNESLVRTDVSIQARTQFISCYITLLISRTVSRLRSVLLLCSLMQSALVQRLQPS